MWFAKWFGGREQIDDTDEPARHEAPVVSQTQTRPAAADKREHKGVKNPGKGFDPYNSGAFERRNAWERINRR
jgi:hypothetical protein